MRILLPLMLLTSLAYTQTPSAQFTTLQLFNGRAWQQFDERSKIMYVSGVRDSIVYFAPTLQHEQGANEFIASKWALGFVVGDYVQELNSFYHSNENVLIPIPSAIDYCTTKLKGQTSKDGLERMLMAMRRLAASAQ